MLTIKIENIDRMAAEIKARIVSMDEVLEKAVMTGGMIIANQGAENAPFKSGHLKSETGSETRVTRVGPFRAEGRVGPRGVPYSEIQEYGGLTGRGYRTRIQGKFYMTRAVATHRRLAEEEMVKIIIGGLTR